MSKPSSTIKNLSTPSARAIWRNVNNAAEGAPAWAKRHVREEHMRPAAEIHTALEMSEFIEKVLATVDDDLSAFAAVIVISAYVRGSDPGPQGIAWAEKELERLQEE